MRIVLPDCVLRSYRPGDEGSLARYADNRAVWRNLRDAFPHPYTRRHAREFIRFARTRAPETLFCIEVGDEAAGGIGFHRNQDVERFSAEVGYWLAEPHWGRGIATQALVALSAHAFSAHGLNRLYATPYTWNPASARVLEKAGYRLEGRLRSSVFKDGQLVDQLLYAKVREDWPGPP